MLGVKQDMHMSAWKKTLIAGLFPGMNIEFSYEMKENQNMLVNTKAKVGVFSIALGAYLPQFPELVPEFRGQYEAFKKTLPGTVELVDGGFVTTKEESQAAGEKFRAADVDLVILQLLTYATSYNMLPAVKDLDVPVILVNVQKKKAPDYQHTDIPTWLGTLYACGAVGEMAADLNRYGKRHAVITGVVEGGDPEVQREIEDWCRAARRSIRSGIWQSMWSHSSSGHRRNGSVWSRPTMTAMRRGRQENSTAC